LDSARPPSQTTLADFIASWKFWLIPMDDRRAAS
jgi:hypothetical protein